MKPEVWMELAPIHIRLRKADKRIRCNRHMADHCKPLLRVWQADGVREGMENQPLCNHDLDDICRNNCWRESIHNRCNETC